MKFYAVFFMLMVQTKASEAIGEEKRPSLFLSERVMGASQELEPSIEPLMALFATEEERLTGTPSHARIERESIAFSKKTKFPEDVIQIAERLLLLDLKKSAEECLNQALKKPNLSKKNLVKITQLKRDIEAANFKKLLLIGSSSFFVGLFLTTLTLPR